MALIHQYHLCKRGWVAEAAAQGRAVVGLGSGGHGAGRRGVPGVGTPWNALAVRLVATLCEIPPKGQMAPLSMLLHIRLVASSLGGSSGVELARARSNRGRAAARRWPAGSLGLGGGVLVYKCILLYTKSIQMTLTDTHTPLPTLAPTPHTTKPHGVQRHSARVPVGRNVM